MGIKKSMSFTACGGACKNACSKIACGKIRESNSSDQWLVLGVDSN